MEKVLCNKWVPDECAASFASELELVMPSKEQGIFSREELLSRIPDYKVLFGVGNIDTDRELIDAGAQLKIIGNFGVGYDNVDVGYATSKGIPVINTPTQVTEGTAEYTLALIMAVFRDVVGYTNQIRNKQWIQHQFGDEQKELFGSTLGVVGMGRIGKAVARRARALDMQVVYYDKYRLSPEKEAELGVVYMELDALLAASDCVTLHMPYTADARHMFGDGLFSKMKQGSFFVNAARGGLVDTQALIRALDSGRIKRAALDVFEREPYEMGALCARDDVVLSPHIASQTRNVRIAMGRECLQGIAALLRGERPYNLVNPECFGG